MPQSPRKLAAQLTLGQAWDRLDRLVALMPHMPRQSVPLGTGSAISEDKLGLRRAARICSLQDLEVLGGLQFGNTCLVSRGFRC